MLTVQGIMETNSSNFTFPACLYSPLKHGYETEYFWISGVILVIIGIFGLLGNVMTITVLCQPQMRGRLFYSLLLALACYDTLFILSYGVSVSYKSVACYPLNNLVDYLAYPFLNMGLLGSIYMTVAISMERYLGICHPNSHLSRKAWMFILPVILISMGYTFPKFFERKWSNGTFERPDVEKNKLYVHSYHLWAEVICITMVPLASLLFLNGSIIVTIFKTTKGATQLRKTHNKQGANTTKILFWIVLIFLVLHSPRVVFKFLFYFGPEKTTWYWVRPVAKLALITNSSVNFLIYCMVGKNFRTELFKLLKMFHSGSKGSGKTNV